VSDRTSSTLELRVAARSGDCEGFAAGRPYVVGYPATSATASAGPHAGGLLLAPVDAAHDAVVRVPEASCLRVADSLDATRALALPALAVALSMWESLRLELGDAAVVTSGSALSALTAQVAFWRGGCPVVELGPAASGAATDIPRIDWSDPEEAVRQLTDATGKRPGFAAIELSGRAEVLDIILEMMPRWPRLLLAGPAGKPVTIDFYKNVHRKGAVIASTDLEAISIFDAVQGAAVRAQLPAATQTLLHSGMAATCLSLLGLHRTARSLTVVG
jgi:threonine dehydrogenase-like Zn-dependent dehydrogenase